MHNEVTKDNIVSLKDRLAASFIVVNAIAWFYTIKGLLENILTKVDISSIQNVSILTAFYVTVIASMIVGAILSNRVKQKKFLRLWIIIGVFVSLVPIILQEPTFELLLVSSILFGASFGIGIPKALAFFIKFTSIENRGLSSGIVFILFNIGAVFLSVGLMKVNLLTCSVVLALWRASGLIIFFMKPKNQNIKEIKINDSFKFVFSDKSFLLYFVAWFMLMLVDGSEVPMVRFFLIDINYTILGPIIGAFSALFSGIIADRFGRKPIIITGFVAYGIAYALIGVAPELTLARYLFIAIESGSMGILVSAFMLLLWGDLARYVSAEKYYAIGTLPFFLTYIVRIYFGEYFLMVPNQGIFSLAAFFLFMAVLPLLFAPETLPKKKIELRRLMSFAEQAKKAKEKFERKC